MRSLFVAFVALFALPATSSAQLFPSSGGAGGRTSSGSGTTTGGLSAPSTATNAAQAVNRASQSAQSGLNTNASTGTAGSANGSTGTTGTGTGTSNGSSMGQGTTGALGAMSGQQVLGATAIGNNNFTGRAANAGFIGNSMAGQQANMNAFNQLFQGMQGGGNGRGMNGGQTNTDRYQLRPTLRVGFDYTPTTATASVTSPKFATRFSGITERRPQLSGVNIASDYEGRVVLSGKVASEGSKSLAAALLRLEPGVREVVNELTVEAPAAQ